MGEASSDSAAGPSASELLEFIPFAEIHGWADDDHASAFAAFVISAARAVAAQPSGRPLGGDPEKLRRVAQAALDQGALDSDGAREFFEAKFRPARIAARGFVTGYYEPEVAASLSRKPRFAVPLYRRPPDLVGIDDASRPTGMDAEMRFARRTPHGIEEYFDRAAIESGALAGHGLELAFVESPVEAFFIHVQGSARLRLVEGGTMRVGFDGKSGHAYTSIGKLTVERGILRREDAHKQGLEGWLKANETQGRALMRENRSFIFFRRTGQTEDEGPLGAAGVPLTAGRSLAVDRTLVTFHTPLWVDAPGLAEPDRDGPTFRRLMISQDTGSAIVGPGRGDIFFGSGDTAETLAGNVRHAAAMTLLLPRDGNAG